MASDIAFVEFVVDQIDNAGEITFKKMFGEFGLYTDGKIFALICRDQLFIKPTNAGKAFIGDPVEAPPYPGAKMYYLIEDEIEDRDWISTLVRVSAEELPLPKPKKKKGQHPGHESERFLERAYVSGSLDFEIRSDKSLSEAGAVS